MAQVDMPRSSINQKPTEPQKKLEKVVKGKVSVKEQTDIQKIASDFLAEDLRTVKSRIISEYLKPMIKNGLCSILNAAINIALWGDDHNRRNSNDYYGGNRAQRNSYDGYYQGSQNNYPAPARRTLQNLDFESRGDADDTLAGLCDAIRRYGQVSVGDLWDLMGVSNDSTDSNSGWYSLNEAYIKGIPGGYRLVLPRTTPLH